MTQCEYPKCQHMLTKTILKSYDANQESNLVVRLTCIVCGETITSFYLDSDSVCKFIMEKVSD